MGDIIQKYPDISDEEIAELIDLIIEGTPTHVYLMKCLQCFANLYCIREVNSLPAETAKEKMT